MLRQQSIRNIYFVDNRESGVIYRKYNDLKPCFCLLHTKLQMIYVFIPFEHCPLSLLFYTLPSSSNGSSTHTESAVQAPPDPHLDRIAAAHHHAHLGAGDDDDAVCAGGGRRSSGQVQHTHESFQSDTRAGAPALELRTSRHRQQQQQQQR